VSFVGFYVLISFNPPPAHERAETDTLDQGEGEFNGFNPPPAHERAETPAALFSRSSAPRFQSAARS